MNKVKMEYADYCVKKVRVVSKLISTCVHNYYIKCNVFGLCFGESKLRDVSIYEN